MRTRPVASKILAAAFFDAAHRQTRGIRGDDCAGTAILFDARKQRALNFEIFRDHLE